MNDSKRLIWPHPAGFAITYLSAGESVDRHVSLAAIALDFTSLHTLDKFKFATLSDQVHLQIMYSVNCNCNWQPTDGLEQLIYHTSDSVQAQILSLGDFQFDQVMHLCETSEQVDDEPLIQVRTSMSLKTISSRRRKEM